MRKLYTLILFAAVVACLVSCDNQKGQGFYLGKAISYDDFLWSDFHWEDVSLPEQTLELEMGEIHFARPIELQVVYKQDKDKDYQPASKVITVLRDNRELKDGIIRINPKDKLVNLKFRFTKKGVQGIRSARYKLSLKINNPGDLDQLNGQEAKRGAIIDTDVMWDVKYEKVMNPLANGLMWFGICFGVIVLVWFLILRRMIFPTFDFDIMQFIYLEGESKKGRDDCSLSGARKVICHSEPKYQSGFNRLMCGRIEYVVNPFWSTPVKMTPCGSDGITVSENLKAGQAANYRMTAMITAQNGPKRPFVVKRVKSEMIVNISIG